MPFTGAGDRINARELREQCEERGVLATKAGGGGYHLGKKGAPQRTLRDPC